MVWYGSSLPWPPGSCRISLFRCSPQMCKLCYTTKHTRCLTTSKWGCNIYTPVWPFERRCYILWQCPFSRASFPEFFNRFWYINLKLGIYIRYMSRNKHSVFLILATGDLIFGNFLFCRFNVLLRYSVKSALYMYAITQKHISERFRFGIHINVGRTLDTSENQHRLSNICAFPDNKDYGANMGPI